MELLDAIYKRRSVRTYADRPVDRATLETLIQAAIQAPSAVNGQSWAFAIVCATSAVPQAAEDCCLAGQNLLLAAFGLGLGACVIGFARPWLNLPAVKQELGIPADYAPVLPIIVRFPSRDVPPVARREPEIFLVSRP